MMKRFLVSLLFLVSLQATTLANGYKILCVKSAKATAMGEAFVVQADDPSAIAFNPAGLWQLDGNQVNVQGTLCNAYTEYTAPDGTTSDNDSEWQLVPSFFLTSDLGTTNMGAGLGVSFPNGLSSKWADDSFARYVATYNKLLVADISPAYSIRLTDRLSLGAGLDYYYSQAEMLRMVDMGALYGSPGSMDVESKLTGDGDAWGGNMGAIYRINPRHAFALTYHLPYTIDYSGDMKLGDQKYDMNTRIDFPAVAVAGYAFHPTPKLKLEFNLDWTWWDQVGNIVVHFDQPGMNDTVLEQDYHNTLAYKLGAEYNLTGNWDLRCGYIYNENAISDETWSPSLPEANTHFLTGGVGYHNGRITVDTAVQLVFYNKRTIEKAYDPNNPYASGINGTYQTFAPCFSLSVSCLF